MNIQDFKSDFDKALEFLHQDVSGLRTGRASAAMVESIMVEAYGAHQPIKAVASIIIQDAKTIVLEPWDKSILANVEKGVRDSGLGMNPVNDGRMIRLNLPELTSERRQELIKILHQKLEAARIAIRKVREDARGLIITEEESGGMGEDEKFKLLEELDEIVKEQNEKIKTLGEKKETEINTI